MALRCRPSIRPSKGLGEVKTVSMCVTARSAQASVAPGLSPAAPETAYAMQRVAFDLESPLD